MQTHSVSSIAPTVFVKKANHGLFLFLSISQFNDKLSTKKSLDGWLGVRTKNCKKSLRLVHKKRHVYSTDYKSDTGKNNQKEAEDGPLKETCLQHRAQVTDKNYFFFHF